MRAVRVLDKQIVVVDAPAPVASAGRHLVKVDSVGICGSDLHIAAEWAPKITLGHEISGHLEDGTPVAIWPREPCWSPDCPNCSTGHLELCDRGPGTLGVRQDGGMADVVSVADASLVRIPASLPLSSACLVEPFACVMHGVQRANAQRGMRVAIIGAGPVGLAAAAVFVWAGCTVDVEARYPHQAAAAERIGAHIGLGADYDIAVDAAGSDTAIARCLDVMRPAGTILMLGSYWIPPTLPALFGNKEPTFITAVGHSKGFYGRDADAAASLLTHMPQAAEAIISHHVPLKDATHAFELAADRKAGVIKVVLDVSDN
ncbi:MAG TPA: alcohol dehydrogenase catalytic domain-containing protein [Jatrophihabitans sp.]